MILPNFCMIILMPMRLLHKPRLIRLLHRLIGTTTSSSLINAAAKITCVGRGREVVGEGIDTYIDVKCVEINALITHRPHCENAVHGPETRMKRTRDATPRINVASPLAVADPWQHQHIY